MVEVKHGMGAEGDGGNKGLECRSIFMWLAVVLERNRERALGRSHSDSLAWVILIDEYLNHESVLQIDVYLTGRWRT